MPLQIINRCSRMRPDRTAVARDLRAAMRRLGCGHAELSVLFVDEAEMRRLNRRYRRRDRPTDVLSFCMRELRRAGDPPTPYPEILGDVVVSLPTIRRQAGRRGVPWQEELHAVLLHGLLHLLGYDHQTPLAHRRMAAMQAALAGGERKGSRRGRPGAA